MADGNLLGGGVVVALAAVLWLIYLIPTWLRRREYMATERNAVKLQQTLRILAEAAEVPEEIRVEATARDVAQTQKALRKVQQRAVAEAKERAAEAARAEEQLVAERRAAEDAQARAEAQAAAEARAWAAAENRARMAEAHARAEVAQRKARAAGAVLPAHAARGIRRGRILASCALLLGVVAVAGGVVLGLAAAVAGAVVAFVVGGVLVLGALAVLGRLAKRVRDARTATRAATTGRFVSGEVYDHAEYEFAREQLADVELPESQPWTPQPLPRPLHLSRGTIAASTMASIAAAAELRRAAARAELEERAERIAEKENPAVAKLAPAKPVAAPAVLAASGAGAVPVVTAVTAASAASAASAGEAAAQPARVEKPSVVASVAPDSRYARMGIVGEQDTPALDLDQVLARRRAV